MKFLVLFFQLVLFIGLSACSTVRHEQVLNNIPPLESPPEINYALFESSATHVINEKAVFELTEKQRKTFLNFYHKQLLLGTKPHLILANFLEERLSNFNYFGETFIAEKSMRLNKGNCMSLAILTTALAEIVNLEVDYREVNTLPVYEKHNNAILASSHVQTVIYDPTFEAKKGYVYFRKPNIIIDYFPVSSNRVSTRILKDSLIARYYVNMASTALVNNNFNEAFDYAMAAYRHEKSSTQVINLMAVLHKKKGDIQTAEQFYQYAINKKSDDLTLLSNYAILLKSQHRMVELDNLNEQIDELYDPNPYAWLAQAYIANQNKKILTAEKYFLKVIEMAPYVHQAYLGLANIYRVKHDNQKAKRILKKGLEWTYEKQEKQSFKKKLYSLEQS